MKKSRIIAVLLAVFLVVADISIGPIKDVQASSSYTFTKVGGGTISSTPVSPKKLNVIVFGRPTCYNTQTTLAAINSLDLLLDEKINFIYADVDGNDENTVKDFASNYYSGIIFCYGNNNSAAWSLSGLGYGSVTLPFVVYVDSKGTVVKSTTGLQTKSEINKNICDCMGYDVVEDEDTSSSKEPTTDDSYYYVTTYGTNIVDETRGMLNDINSFRLGNDAWYYDRAGNKVKCTNLSGLTYDYRLESAAYLRAAELSLYYNHTRPNGFGFETAVSRYWDYTSLGENIAFGYDSISEVFTAWREDNEGYNGQGHRRNMLSPYYNAVGVACFEVDGVKFWVQEFGYTDFSDSSQTTPSYYDGFDSFRIRGNESIVPIKEKIKLNTGDITMNVGDAIYIDTGMIVDEFNIHGQLMNLGYSVHLYTNVSIENQSIVEYSNGKYHALSAGTTYISVTDDAYEKEGDRVTKRVKVTVSEPQKKEDDTSNDSSGSGGNDSSSVDDSSNEKHNENNNSDKNTSNGSSGSGSSGSGSSGSSSSGGSSTGSSSGKSASYTNEWNGGKWYNADGSQTYGPTLSWKYNGIGWWVEDSSGWYPTATWQKIDGYWYYFHASGYMASGEWVDGYWLNYDGSWTYPYTGSWHYGSGGWWYGDTSGWYATGWQKVDGYWYYFLSDGYMATSRYIDGYWVGADGACR